MTATELGAQPAFPGTCGDTEDAGLTVLQLFTLGAMVGFCANANVVTLASIVDDLVQTNTNLAVLALNQARAQLDALAKEAA